MFKWKKPKNFPALLFVVASIATLILFMILNFLLVINNYSRKAASVPAPGSRYYLNEDYDPADPMITRNPELGDMITGPIITDIEPSIGNMNASVVIVEYSDYVCDYCREQEMVINRILEEYDGQVRFVWKDFPEDNVDSVSWMSAKAARCAGDQGRYWEYHNSLFSASEINDDYLMNTAKDLDLNISAFNSCMVDEFYDDVITDNIVEAGALGINGIPFIYVNDREMLGGLDYSELKRIIDLELLVQ